MNKKTYKLMDWPLIEGIIYADESYPNRILGVQKVKGANLVQCFFPDADSVEAICGKKVYQMELADENGFFAVLVNEEIKETVKFRVFYKKGKKEYVEEVYDAYSFDLPSSPEDVNDFLEGRSTNIDEYFGAHKATISGIEGMLFRLYAPFAVRVSVIGKFNNYDGRINPMIRGEEGIYTLFLPGLNDKTPYLYEIRKRGGEVILKNDPFAGGFVMDKVKGRMSMPLTPVKKAHSVRKKVKAGEPFLIYSLSEGETLTAEKVKKIKSAGFNFISLCNYLPEERRGSVHVTTSFFERNTDLIKKIEMIHKEGLRASINLSISSFLHDSDLLECFDGSHIFEDSDERASYNRKLNISLFKYDLPVVRSYLYSAVNRVITESGSDTLCLSDTSFMLYLDYDKDPGDYIPNANGGNENLNAISFMKDFNYLLKNIFPGIIVASDEFTGWQNITTPIEEGGFGFDYKMHHAFTNELMKYGATDPVARSAFHHDITMSFLYQNMEHFTLALTEDEFQRCDCSFTSLWDGVKDVFYAYTMVHPGNKAFADHFIEGLSDSFIKKSNEVYLKNPALYENGTNENSFEWINSLDSSECLLSFIRRSEDQTLVIVVNFAGCMWENKLIGVPYDGKYKEIYSSSESGQSTKNVRARKETADLRENSVKINIPALSVNVYEYVPYTEKELSEMKAKEDEKLRKAEEARKQKELLKAKKAKIRASMKEELARKIAKAEEEIARGSELKKETKTKKK